MAAASFCMPGNNVAVEVQRDADLAVAEPFAGDLRVGSGCKQVRGMSVPEIMESEMLQPRLADGPGPVLGDVDRLHHGPVCMRHHQIVG